MKTLLNIGCGTLTHKDCINIDLYAASTDVLEFDIRKGLPFESNSFENCYTSHMLEHLRRDDADFLISECNRVLIPDGILRIVVPDLESIAREYLAALNRALESQDKESAVTEYDWMMIELYDQTVREKGGGDMSPFLRDPSNRGNPFIFGRIGSQTSTFWSTTPARHRTFARKLREKRLSGCWKFLRERTAKLLVQACLGAAVANEFEVAIFRSQGQIHRWMYDRFSLKRLVTHHGFTDFRITTALESKIPDFDRYKFDAIDGVPLKPNSIFIEASKQSTCAE